MLRLLIVVVQCVRDLQVPFLLLLLPDVLGSFSGRLQPYTEGCQTGCQSKHWLSEVCLSFHLEHFKCCFYRQLESFSRKQQKLEILRLQNKFGDVWVESQKEELYMRLHDCRASLVSGELCGGRCVSRSQCPGGVCKPDTRRSSIFK